MRERDGALYPAHDVGWPLILAPVLRVAYPTAHYLGDTLPSEFLRSARLDKPLLLRHQLSLLMAVLTGLLARELFLILLGCGLTHRSAFWWALLFALSPPVLAHSFLVFTEIPTALAAAWITRRLLLGQRSQLVTLILGFVAGFLFLVHARNAGLVLGLFGALIVLSAPRERLNSAGTFGIGLSLALIMRTAITYSLWGTFVTTPHAALGILDLQEAGREMFVRMSGVLFDREHGLLAYAPIFAAALPAWIVYWRRGGTSRRTAIALLLIIACYTLPILLPALNIHGWRGGWSPAARFLVPIVAFLWLPLPQYWRALAPSGRLALAGMISAQITIDLYLWQSPRSFWNDGDGASAFAWTAWFPSWSVPASTASFMSSFAVLLFLGWLCSHNRILAPRPDPIQRG